MIFFHFRNFISNVYSGKNKTDQHKKNHFILKNSHKLAGFVFVYLTYIIRRKLIFLLTHMHTYTHIILLPVGGQRNGRCVNTLNSSHNRTLVEKKIYCERISRNVLISIHQLYPTVIRSIHVPHISI